MHISLDLFNDRQREAVINTEGPYMIIAGAGSGKTSVLTSRIAYLIKEKNVDPSRILALTFTNKAAEEMKHRIQVMIGPVAKNVWLGTFHGCFSRILRLEAEVIGYPSSFSIYDTADSKSLLKAIIKEMNLDDTLYNPPVVYSRISSAKNRLITPQEYNQHPAYQQEDIAIRKPSLGEIYLRYTNRCLQAAAMDFDDILLHTYLLFKQHDQILHTYQQRFQYVLIDEFQDTNRAQYMIVKQLVGEHKNICVVGDDAQSIYAFRGANIQNILNFEKDYPAVTITMLEQNYRSTQHIVEAANSVIKNNFGQLKKNVWTANKPGEVIGLMRAASDIEEGRQVAMSILEIKLQHQLINEDFAILYRTNSQSRTIEEALRKFNLPYRLLGGMSFYQRKEVKDLLAYLRFITNPNDEEALKRIINEPKRGIGPSNVDKMILIANQQAIPLWSVLTNVKEFLTGRIAIAVDSFVSIIHNLMLQLPQKDAYEMAVTVAKNTGFLHALHEDKTIEGIARYENVQELLNAIKVFTLSPEQIDTRLVTFLQHVALVTDSELSNQNDGDKVSLMTIHAAKGLEFRYVYIVGLEEDLFPSPLMLGSKEELEEERRLFYVALTRAKEKVFLSYSLSRYRFGKFKTCESSRFLLEIAPSCLQPMLVEGNYTESSKLKYASNFVRNVQYVSRKPLAKLKAPLPSQQSSSITEAAMELFPGMSVQHSMFGKGVVVQIDEILGQKKVNIRFEKQGEKTLLLKFAKLQVVEQYKEISKS